MDILTNGVEIIEQELYFKLYIPLTLSQLNALRKMRNMKSC